MFLKETIKNSDVPIEMTDKNEFEKMDADADGLFNMDSWKNWLDIEINLKIIKFVKASFRIWVLLKDFFLYISK